MSYGKKVQVSISKINFRIDQNETDYSYAKRVERFLENATGLKILVMTDASSSNNSPRLNVTAWTPKGREIKNPDLKGLRNPPVNYFYA